MSYSVKEIFLTLQGEGANAGSPAVFCRFAGCNLWSGREVDRATASCTFCDTDFVGTDGPGGGRFDRAVDLAAAIDSQWQGEESHKLVVCTGGEPLLQLDGELIDALHAVGFRIAVETNGTIPAPINLDWLCVSPKAGTEVVQQFGDELKLVFPQSGLDPATFKGWRFTEFFLQPKAGPELAENTRLAIAYCQANPRWRLSVQIHKLLGIP